MPSSNEQPRLDVTKIRAPKTAHSHVRVKAPRESLASRIPSAAFWILYALATLAFWGWAVTHGCGA